MKKQKTLTNKGFSMIELIIVIAIMAILIAVMAPVLTKYIESTRVSRDTQLADSVKTAVETSLVDPDVLKASPSVIPAAGTYTLSRTTAVTGGTAITDNAFWDNVAKLLGYANVAAMQTAATGLEHELTSDDAEAINVVVSGSGTSINIVINIVDAEGAIKITVD